MRKTVVINEIREAVGSKDALIEDLSHVVRQTVDERNMLREANANLARTIGDLREDLRKQEERKPIEMGQIRRATRSGSLVQIVGTTVLHPTLMPDGVSANDVRTIAARFVEPNDPTRPLRFFSPNVVRRWEVVEG